MADPVGKELKEWVEATLEGTSVSLAPPSDEGEGVHLYLMGFGAEPPARSTRTRVPLQLALRYLVTAYAEAPEEAHSLLVELAFAAMEHDDVELDLDPIPAALWSAFGVRPRPAFVLVVPLRRERPQPEVPYVRQPLVVHAGPVTRLEGIVLGPDRIPVVGASVELPDLRMRTRTDRRGAFQFKAVPGASVGKRLRIRAKGQEVDVQVDEQALEADPFIIHFDPTS